MLTNSWVSKARKRNENNRKQTSIYWQSCGRRCALFTRTTICFANIYTNEIYVKLILNWFWNANSSWPDILFTRCFSFTFHIVYTRMNREYFSFVTQAHIKDMNVVNRLKYECETITTKNAECSPVTVAVNCYNFVIYILIYLIASNFMCTAKFYSALPYFYIF